jgi:hypothetical protein
MTCKNAITDLRRSSPKVSEIENSVSNEFENALIKSTRDSSEKVRYNSKFCNINLPPLLLPPLLLLSYVHQKQYNIALS